MPLGDRRLVSGAQELHLVIGRFVFEHGDDVDVAARTPVLEGQRTDEVQPDEQARYAPIVMLEPVVDRIEDGRRQLVLVGHAPRLSQGRSRSTAVGRAAPV